MFAQQALKEQNCNFASFENSGEDLINEVSIRPLARPMVTFRLLCMISSNYTVTIQE